MSYETAKARLEKTTPGEWREAQIYEPSNAAKPTIVVETKAYPPRCLASYLEWPNAQFVACAKQDMEVLLEIVRELQEWISESKAHTLSRTIEHYNNLLDSLQKFEELP